MVLTKEELGQRIKTARRYKTTRCGKKYTQSMLAKDVGVSRSYLGDIEAGRKYPNYALLSKIAEACEVPIILFDAEHYNQAFKKLRIINNISLKDLSNKINVPVEYLEKIENNEEISLSVEQWLAVGKELKLSPEETFKIIFADVFYTSIPKNTDKFMEYDLAPKNCNSDSNPQYNNKIPGCNNAPNDSSTIYMIPVYDGLSFSQSAYTDEYFPLDARSIINRGYSKQELFYYRIQGDHMSPTLLDRELALIHRQSAVDLNEIAMVLLNTGETTIVRIVATDNKIILNYDNRTLLPRVLNKDECEIIGKAIKRVGDIK
ncbi:MAG: XRE family transcriptional regulator [Smithella sp.]